MLVDARMRNLAIGLAVGAGIGAGGAYAYLSRVQPTSALQQQQQRSPSLPTAGAAGAATADDPASLFRADHPALRFGVPQTETLRFYEGFVASFDHRTRNPKWVLEHITRDSLRGAGTREQSQFFEDGGVEERFRSKLDDYWNSGYDRGHMAPAANHRASQKAMDDTFSLSNISPQVGPGFNRDFWARFEKMCKDAAKTSDGVYIVTGPLWLPSPAEDGRGGGGGQQQHKWEMRHPLIGKPPRLVSVPTHYFKVVLSDNSSGKHGAHAAAVGAFVMPNAAIDPATPVTAFAVPLEALESVAGAKFFPTLITDRRRAALDAAALAWQEEGRQRLQTLDRLSLEGDHAALLPAPAPSGANGGKKPSGPAAALAALAPSGNKNKQQQQVQQQQQSSNRKTVGDTGAVHLCDVMACRLPAERWWENDGRGPSGGGGSGNSGGGGGGPQRQGSRGRPRKNQQVVAADVAEAAAEVAAAGAAEARPVPTAAAEEAEAAAEAVVIAAAAATAVAGAAATAAAAAAQVDKAPRRRRKKTLPAPAEQQQLDAEAGGSASD